MDSWCTGFRQWLEYTATNMTFYGKIFSQFNCLLRNAVLEYLIFLYFREHLQEQAKLVLEENQILMEQIDLKDRRLEEIQQEQQDQGKILLR